MSNRHFSSPSYSESGAGALNLDVNRFSSSEFIVGVGTLAYYQIDNSSRMFGNVNIGYENDLTELSNLSFSYNFQGEGSDYTNHVISAKYTFKF